MIQNNVAGQESKGKGKNKDITVSDRQNVTLTRYCDFKCSIYLHIGNAYSSKFVFFCFVFLQLLFNVVIHQSAIRGLCCDHNKNTGVMEISTTQPSRSTLYTCETFPLVLLL